MKSGIIKNVSADLRFFGRSAFYEYKSLGYTYNEKEASLRQQ